MDDTSLRSLATSHPLEPEAPENVSKKARNARNLLHIRGPDELKFDVNEKALLNANLITSLGSRGRFDRRTSHRQSEGWRRP